MLAWPMVSLFRCIHQRCLFLLFLWIVKDKTCIVRIFWKLRGSSCFVCPSPPAVLT